MKVLLCDDEVTKDMIRKKLHGLIYALLSVTHTTLESIEVEIENVIKTPKTKDDVIKRQEKLASTFRNLMTKGQSFQGPNTYRNDFYKKVTQLADESEVSFR